MIAVLLLHFLLLRLPMEPLMITVVLLIIDCSFSPVDAYVHLLPLLGLMILSIIDFLAFLVLVSR